MLDIEKWKAQATLGSYSFRYKYNPLFGGKYGLEKGYVVKGERLSWSHHDSFVVVGSQGICVQDISDMYSYIAKCFGMEVIELNGYYLNSGEAISLDEFGGLVEEKGYYYGAYCGSQIGLIPSSLKQVCFVQNPIEVIYQEFLGAAEEDFESYVMDDARWVRFERLLDSLGNENVMLVRVEGFCKSLKDTIRDSMLFLCGHEPYALVSGAVDTYLDTERLLRLGSLEHLSAMSESLLSKVWEHKGEVLKALGYEEEGLSKKSSYTSEMLKRTI